MYTYIHTYACKQMYTYVCGGTIVYCEKKTLTPVAFSLKVCSLMQSPTRDKYNYY